MNFNGTLDSLIECYKTDKVSPYVRKIRHCTRRHYDALLRRLSDDHGAVRLTNIRVRDLHEWHETWLERSGDKPNGNVSMAHSLIGMMRTLVGFGMTMLEERECERLSVVLSKLKFPMGKPRSERLTAAQVVAIRAKAHEMGRPSIALANAIQFEGTLRQKDVIGEWVPLKEHGKSDVQHKDRKWMRGIRWEEIDENLILDHITSKREKPIKIPLLQAPMVVEELRRAYPGCISENLVADRSKLPASGPVIVRDKKPRPWTADEFRRQWRKAADAAGVPNTVRNMDSRAGAITEALDSGVLLDHARKAATHSDGQMTQRYSRGEDEIVGNVMTSRAQHRARNVG